MGHYEDTKLWNAIGKRDPSAVRKALVAGANPNARGHKTLYGRSTTLQVAAEKLDDVAIEVLLSAGARQAPGRHGATPLIELTLAIPLAGDDELSTRLLRSLDLLLAKRPNLEVEGGEPSRFGNVVHHVLRLPMSSLVDRVQDRLFEAMARRKKFSDDFSATVLMAAFKFRDVEVFEKLIGLGLNSQLLGEYGVSPAVQLCNGMKKDPEGQWWPVLARHNVPVGPGSPGIPDSVLDLARSKTARLRLEMGLDQPTSPTSRPRF